MRNPNQNRRNAPNSGWVAFTRSAEKMESPEVVRKLVWFEKNPGERMVGETILVEMALSRLQDAFGVEANNPMFDSWPVEAVHLEFLKQHTTIEINTSKCDYFVEAEAVEG